MIMRKMVCVCVDFTDKQIFVHFYVNFFFVNQCQGALSFLFLVLCTFPRNWSMFTLQRMLCSIFSSFILVSFFVVVFLNELLDSLSSQVCWHWQAISEEIRHTNLMYLWQSVHVIPVEITFHIRKRHLSQGNP